MRTSCVLLLLFTFFSYFSLNAQIDGLNANPAREFSEPRPEDAGAGSTASNDLSSPLPDNAAELPDQEGIALAKCDVYENILCGTAIQRSTSAPGAGNDFGLADYPGLQNITTSAFDGPDLLYRLQITSQTRVQIVLNILTAGEDLDMFLLTNCSTPVLKAYTGESNVTAGIGYNEVIEVNLTPGYYFLVVDGYNASQAGTFTLSVDCVGNSLEPAADMSAANKYWNDDFENYNTGNLDPQSNRWRLWNPGSGTPTVINSSGNKVGKFTYSATAPDVIYKLSEGNAPAFDQPKTSGRWRMSWRMQIQSGKEAYYNVLHQNPDENGDNAVWAYHVYFTGNGLNEGHLVLGNGSNPTFKTFTCPDISWVNVVNIVDLDKDSAELWINNAFVATWKFSTATSGAALKQLDGVDFFADVNNDFLIDNLSVWQKVPGANCYDQSLGDLVCLSNGLRFNGPLIAGCELYSSFEYTYCEDICDYGGTFIYRGQKKSGRFDNSDRAPGKLRTMQCVIDAYNGNVPQELYSDTYIFYNDKKSNFAALSWQNVPNSNTRCFIMQCHQKFSGPQKAENKQAFDCIYTPRCGCPVSPFVSTVFLSDNPVTFSCSYYNSIFNCDDFYYIVVTGTKGETYTDLLVEPSQSVCPDDNTITELQCGDFQFGNTVYSNPISGQYFTSFWPGNAYPCYGGFRDYSGGEAFYKFTIDQPQKVTINVQSSTPMGVFLYNYICGRNCIQYAGSVNDLTSLSATLDNGTYYLIVDSDNPGGSDNFVISMDCEITNMFNPTVLSVLDFSDPPNCPPNTGINHQVTIPNQASSGVQFDNTDYVQFLFPQGVSGKKTTQELTKPWTQPVNSPQSFSIYGDQTGDSYKCGYYGNDKIYIRRIQFDNEGARRLTDYDILYAPLGGGNNAQDRFVTNGVSQVTKLIPKPTVAFGMSENEKLLRRDQFDSTAVLFNTNQSWAVQYVDEYPGGTGGWLELSQYSGFQGITRLTFKALSSNDSYIPRSVLLKFYAVNNADNYFQYVRVVQAGYCVPIFGLSVDATPGATVCRGDSITLSASTFTGGDQFYKYLWSTGQTTQSIKIAPSNSGEYTVTVTNPNFCDASNVQSTSITIKNPPTVVATGGSLSCQNNAVTLSVVTNAGPATYAWSGPNGFTSIQMNPVVFAAGTYTVTVTPNAAGSCKGTATASVSGNNVPPQIVTSVDGPLNCDNPVTLISASASNAGNPNYHWAGPGNFSSNEQSPFVSAGGTYTVTVTGSNGCSATATLSVPSNFTIPQLTAGVSGKIPCNLNPVQLLASSNAQFADYSWVGPNNFFSQQTNPSVSVTGIYTVTVIDLINGCSNTASVQVESDTNVPNASAGGGAITCSNPTITLSGSSTSSGVSYLWTGPDNFSMAGQNVAVSVAGVYTFRVTFNATGCSKSVSVTVSEDKTPPGASATGGTITCAVPSITLGGASGGAVGWAWSGPGNFTSNLQNPPVSVAGNYMLTTTGANGCTSTATANVQQNKVAPTVVIMPPGVLSCSQSSLQLNGTGSSQGVEFTYLWSSIGGNIVTGSTTLFPTVNQGGTYILMITNQTNGCTASASVTVSASLDLPQADAGPSKTLTCSAPSVQLNGSGSVGAAFQYLWTGPGAILNPTTLTPTVNQAGTFTLKVENTLTHCINTDTVQVLGSPSLPPVTLSPPQTITCAGNHSVQLSASTSDPSIVFEWFSPVNVSLGNSPTITVTNPGQYTLIIESNLTGCSDTKLLDVGLDTLAPAGGAGLDQVICAGNTWVLGQGNSSGFQYQWSPAGLLNNPNAASPLTSPNANQQYSVTITDPGNHCTTTDSALIGVSPAIGLDFLVVNELTCHDDADGILLAVATGGTPPLNYLWSNGVQTAENKNLSAGIYTVTVSDQAACARTLPFELAAPQGLTASTVTISPPAGGSPNGFIFVSVTGGTTPYAYQWYLNGVAVPNETNPLIKDLSDVTGYTLLVTDARGCTRVFLSASADHEPVLIDAEVKLFPNPSSGIVNIGIDMPGSSAAVELEVFDLLGRRIKTQKALIAQQGNIRLDLSGQIAGVYFLKININGALPIVRAVSIVR